MATSLSSITDLGIYRLENSTPLNNIINGQDIKIEISLESSNSDNSKSYSSHKLDLNQLLNIIKTYVDNSINNLSSSVDDISTYLSTWADSKFVKVIGENRQISATNLTIKTENNLKLHSNDIIQLSSNSNDNDNMGIQLVTRQSQIMLATDGNITNDLTSNGAIITLKTGNNDKHIKILNKKTSSSNNAKDNNKIECVATAALWN